DGPRGRIYLIKQVLEGGPVSSRTQLHLDRCLSCRSCETTCPSGVQYARLLDIGREVVEKRVPRDKVDAAKRTALRRVLPGGTVFGAAVQAGQWMRWMLPPALKRKVPPAARDVRGWPRTVHARKVVVLDGCVQPSLSPNTNGAAARVLDKLGITVLRAPRSGCCGAVSLHLNAEHEALDYMRRNIDAWWPLVEQGAEAILITATGCASVVKDYGYQLARDAAYAAKAKRISDIAKDISEVLIAEQPRLRQLLKRSPSQRYAFQSPCSLQHGLKMPGKVEALLTSLGFELTPVRDAHLCCGSAGTYSLLQPEIAEKLLQNKVKALLGGAPDTILTANIGCQMHIQTGTRVPVRHWIETLDDLLSH
ncbi:MAG TPA: glycolate oxidase subunit GlcF, partial [Burkholderiales bacterium]|nr:glycolate oxidase subunit GlcF [Burkholderiales bacterium]